MTRKELSKTLGLSCVEKYFLAWMKNYCNISELYYDSFISLERIFEDFQQGAEYETYAGIKRIQDLAEQAGLVTHRFCRLSYEAALETIRNQNGNELILMRSSPAFFSASKRIPWRKDHYLFVDGALRWLNEYPLSEGIFSEEEFMRAYGGWLIIFCNKEKCMHVYSDENRVKIRNQKFGEIPELDLKSCESVVGILRITRKRLAEYYAKNEVASQILECEIDLLDQTYFLIHKMLLTGDKTGVVVRNKLLEIQNYEKKLKEILS